LAKSGGENRTGPGQARPGVAEARTRESSIS
jgi:hypothetical protein